MGFSLGAASRGYSLDVVRGLFIAEGSCVWSRGSRALELQQLWLAHGLNSCGGHGLSCFMACGIFLDQEANLRLLVSCIGRCNLYL